MDHLGASQYHPEIMTFYRQIAIPRGMGTENAKYVQELIASHFSKLSQGQVTRQDFTAGKVFMNGVLNLVHPVVGLFVLLTIVFAVTNQFFFGLIFSGITLVWSYFSRQIIRKLQNRVQHWGTQYPSQNIIWDLPPQQEKHQTLVFMAHHDSKSCILSPFLEGFAYAMGFIFAVFYAFHALIYMIGSLARGSSFGSPWQLIWGVLIVGFTWLLLVNLKGNNSAGVIDDASGVAQIFGIAKYFNDHPPIHTRVICVASGAEEWGDYGAEEFIRSNPCGVTLADTRFIFIDGIGIKQEQGENVIWRGIGLPPKAFAPNLEPICQKINSEMQTGFSFKSIPPLLQVAGDFLSVQDLGYEFLWFASSSFAYHSPIDNWDILDEDAFRNVIRHLIELVTQIDNKNPAEISIQ
jgi:hypothetical protein